MKWIQKLFVVLFVVLALSAVMAYDFADAVDLNNDGVGIAPYPVTGEDDIYAVLDFEVEDPIYVWENNDELTDYDSNKISASETEVGNKWKVTVSYMQYVGGYVGYVEVELGSETVIVEEVEEPIDDNHAPRATDIHFTVIEGDLVDVDMVQDSSVLRFNNHFLSTRVRQSDVVYTYDADGDTLVIGYDSLLNINGVWQTGNDDAGVYTVIATVTDGTDSTEATITITVEDNGIVDGENTCPVVIVNDVVVEEGELAVADYIVSDADGDILVISFSSPYENHGEWQTAVGDEGVYFSIISVSDGECVEEVQFMTTVTCLDANDNGVCDDEEPVEPENTAPVIEDVTDVEVDEGEIVNVCPVVTDVEGDVLIYTYEGIPGGSYDANGCWTWNTDYNDAGEYDVDVCVSDGELSDCTSFEVEVNDVCDDENENGICDEDEYIPSNFEGGLLKVQYVTVLNAKDLSNGNDDEIKVYVEMQNDNSYDAENIKVTLIFEGEDYIYNFEDLDRSEVGSVVYTVEVPESLETGRYPLMVKINNEDINYETAFNLDIEGLSNSVINVENLTLWEQIVSFFRNLF